MHSFIQQKLAFSIKMTVPETLARLQEMTETQKLGYFDSLKQGISTVKTAWDNRGQNTGQPYDPYPVFDTVPLTGETKWYFGKFKDRSFELEMLYNNSFILRKGKFVKCRGFDSRGSRYKAFGKVREDEFGTRVEVKIPLSLGETFMLCFFLLIAGPFFLKVLYNTFTEGLTDDNLFALPFLAVFCFLPYFLITRSFKSNVKSIKADLLRLFDDKIVQRY